MNARTRPHAAVLLIAALLPTAPALADDSAKAAAEQLFREGRALFLRKEYAEACERFAASQRLEPRIGTQLNLAECLEHLGKLAGAWAHYREVHPLAERDGQSKRAARARERAAAIEPRVPRLIVRVDDGDLARLDAAGQALAVTRDGVVLERSLWGAALYVNPGHHEVRATGPEVEPFAEAVTVAEGATEEVVVRVRAKPPVVLAPRPPVRAPTMEVVPWWRRSRTATITGAIGVAAVGTSLALGFVANREWDGAHDTRDCVDGYCNSRGQARTERARQYAVAATVTAAAGAAAIAASVYLVLRSPRERSRLVVLPVEGGAGLAWEGLLP